MRQGCRRSRLGPLSGRLAWVTGLLLAGLSVSWPASAEIYSIRFCNNFSQRVYFAIAYQQSDGNWLSRGWMHIEPNECGDFDTALRVPIFYFRAVTAFHRVNRRRVRLYWGSGEGNFVVAASTDAFFNFYGAQTKESGDDMEPFSKYMSGHDLKAAGEFHATVTLNADGSVNSSIAGKGEGLVDGTSGSGAVPGSDSTPDANTAQGDAPGGPDRPGSTNDPALVQPKPYNK